MSDSLRTDDADFDSDLIAVLRGEQFSIEELAAAFETSAADVIARLASRGIPNMRGAQP
jgi:hypothetical protein